MLGLLLRCPFKALAAAGAGGPAGGCSTGVGPVGNRRRRGGLAHRQLSQQRAEAVCLYITAHSVATAQLRPVGYDGTQPVAGNTDPAQCPRNCRVVLRRL